MHKGRDGDVLQDFSGLFCFAHSMTYSRRQDLGRTLLASSKLSHSSWKINAFVVEFIAWSVRTFLAWRPFRKDLNHGLQVCLQQVLQYQRGLQMPTRGSNAAPQLRYSRRGEKVFVLWQRTRMRMSQYYRIRESRNRTQPQVKEIRVLTGLFPSLRLHF